MTIAPPEIPCHDYWPHGIPKSKLKAYQAMLDAGQITKPSVVVNSSTGAMAVSYLSTIPREWLLQEMQQIANATQQIQMEVIQ